MSFWPFTNQTNSNLHLQKYLNTCEDFTAVSVASLINDQGLFQEILTQLQHMKNNQKNYNDNLNNNKEPKNLNSVNISVVSDSVFSTFFNNENENPEKTREKLLDLLSQEHLIDEFVDYLTLGLSFFSQENKKQEEKMKKIIETDEEYQSYKKYLNDSSESKTCFSEGNNQEKEETIEEKTNRQIQSSVDLVVALFFVNQDVLIKNQKVMDKLWYIFSHTNLRNCYPLTSYIVHILGLIVDYNSNEFMDFLKLKPNLVDVMISNIDIQIMVDFFFKILQTDKPDATTGILDTLSEQNLIYKLIEILKPDISPPQNDFNYVDQNLDLKQSAVTDFIKVLISISSNTISVILDKHIGPNKLTRELVSPRIINIMINDIMLFEYTDPTLGKKYLNKNGIINCVSILLEIIRKNNSDYDLNCNSYDSMLQSTENNNAEKISHSIFNWLKDIKKNPPKSRDPIYLGDMLEIFANNLDKFECIINLPSDLFKYKNLNFLGLTRFRVSELIAELLHCSNMIMINSNKIKKILKIRDKIRFKNEEKSNQIKEKHVDDSDENINSVNEMANFISKVSLDNGNVENQNKFLTDEIEDSDLRLLLFDLINNNENDEPNVSTEKPFVCPERDKYIREHSSVGDHFKYKLIDLNILYSIISKLSEFPFHNFFHNVVFDLIQQIFNGKLNSYNSFLIVELFRVDKCNLIDLIIKSYKNNTEPRPGYMGHLILISEEIVKFFSFYKPDLISPIINNCIHSEDWEWFINEILLKTREFYNVVLGGECNEIENNNNRCFQNYSFDSNNFDYFNIDNYRNGSYDRKMMLFNDKANVDFFSGNNDFEDICDNLDESKIPEIKVQDISPNVENCDLNDIYSNDYFTDKYEKNDFLDNFSESCSSDDELYDEECNND